jgi:hypothetical protein
MGQALSMGRSLGMEARMNDERRFYFVGLACGILLTLVVGLFVVTLGMIP